MRAYCLSKAAVNYFTKVLGEEEAHITALAFDPGIVDTAIQEVIRSKGAPGMHAGNHALSVPDLRQFRLN